jgi:hypothetical protein
MNEELKNLPGKIPAGKLKELWETFAGERMLRLLFFGYRGLVIRY